MNVKDIRARAEQIRAERSNADAPSASGEHGIAHLVVCATSLLEELASMPALARDTWLVCRERRQHT